MMKTNFTSIAGFFALIILLGLGSCKSSQKAVSGQGKSTTSGKNDDGKIEIVFLQINDVYEIAPLEGGRVGGMARIASLKKQLKQKNENTYAVLAGDFLSPSLLGTIKYEGKAIKGKQMVEAMNAAGIDMVAFGNHEFDIKENELQERLNESAFTWISSNTRHFTKEGKIEPFAKITPSNTQPIQDTYIIDAKDKDGTAVKLGIFSVTLPANRADYVRYGNCDSAARAAYIFLKKQCDIVVGLTHQSLEEDLALAKSLPMLRLVMGGHEHNNMLEKADKLTVAKADANAKTAYVHTLTFDKKTRILNIASKLVNIDSAIPIDPQTDAVVQKWMGIGNNNMKELGFNPSNIVADVPMAQAWEGRETFLRNQPTNLATLIARAMSAAAPKTDCAILNTGSIRIDDQMMGKITEYDILRALPFGGGLVEVSMKGTLLQKILDMGEKNKGSGGYLQYDKVAFDAAQKKWLIGGQALDAQKTYRVVLPAFLMTGKEKNMDFLTDKNLEVVSIDAPKSDNKTDLRNDIRMALIGYLSNKSK